jgi:hypothetical protein
MKRRGDQVGQHSGCSLGHGQERAIMRHADELGRELDIETLTIQACGREEILHKENI